MTLVPSSMALHAATAALHIFVLSPNVRREKSPRHQFPIDTSLNPSPVREEKSFHNQLNITMQKKKTKTNIVLISETVLAQLQGRKLGSRIAAPNGAVTGTGQPRFSRMTFDALSAMNFSKASLQA